MTAVNDTLGKEIISNEVTLEHKIKSVDQNLDDKFELVIEEANSLRKNIAESIQANNKSLKLFENVSLISSLSDHFSSSILGQKC